MIITDLQPPDKGRYAIYSDGRGKIERGRIKGWSDTVIWVVYNCNDDWENYEDYTGQATAPEDLAFDPHN